MALGLPVLVSVCERLHCFVGGFFFSCLFFNFVLHLLMFDF